MFLYVGFAYSCDIPPPMVAVCWSYCRFLCRSCLTLLFLWDRFFILGPFTCSVPMLVTVICWSSVGHHVSRCLFHSWTVHGLLWVHTQGPTLKAPSTLRAQKTCRLLPPMGDEFKSCENSPQGLTLKRKLTTDPNEHELMPFMWEDQICILWKLINKQDTVSTGSR